MWSAGLRGLTIDQPAALHQDQLNFTLWKEYIAICKKNVCWFTIVQFRVEIQGVVWKRFRRLRLTKGAAPLSMAEVGIVHTQPSTFSCFKKYTFKNILSKVKLLRQKCVHTDAALLNNHFNI